MIAVLLTLAPSTAIFPFISFMTTLFNILSSLLGNEISDALGDLYEDIMLQNFCLYLDTIEPTLTPASVKLFAVDSSLFVILS